VRAALDRAWWYAGALVVALTAGGCKHEAAAPSSASATETTTPPPAAPDFKSAIATVNLIKGEQSGDARDRSCTALRNLAEHFNDSAECQAPLLKVIAENPGGDLSDCYLEYLPTATVGIHDLCVALVESLKRSKYGTYEIGAIAQQEAGCQAQLGEVIAREAKRFAKYADGYKDVGGAELLYLRRLSEHMTPEQKKALAAAAKTLATRAKAKGARIVDDAEKLASLN
jgi:hypothetical protein